MAQLFQADIMSAITNPLTRVVLDIRGGPGGQSGTVVSWLSEDFSYSAGNRFESPFESFGTDKLNGGIQATQQGTVSAGGGFRQVRVGHPSLTIGHWMGSEKFGLQLTLNFVALRPSDDPTAKIQLLNRLVYPSFEDGGLVFSAPNGYRPTTDLNQATGTVALKIGTWFATPPVFVARTMVPVFSRAPIVSGKPLYMTVQLGLESYRMLSAEEVNSFFGGDGSARGQAYNPLDIARQAASAVADMFSGVAQEGGPPS